MSEIKLVTLNDEPALALGEFLLSEDGETLYVGSGTVQSGTEVIYRGISPIQIKSGVFSRLRTINGIIKTPVNNIILSEKINKTIITSTNEIKIKPANIVLNLKEE